MKRLPRFLGGEAGSVRSFEDWSKVMRLAAICFAVSTLAASSSLAQTVPALPGSRSTGRPVTQAPIGHRQPAVSDLPPDVARKEGQPEEEAPSRAQTPPGRGGGPPTLQVGTSCAAAGQGAVILGRNKEACLADEKAAQDTLKQNWSKFSAAVKSQCAGLEIVGGPASYVELLSCLEVMRDAKSIEATDPLAGDIEPSSRAAASESRRRSGRRHRTHG
jgi:hypothetical protein